MKILIFSHSGLITGGAEQCLMEYVAVLIDKGYDCRVVIPSRGDMSRVLSERGVDHKIIGYGWATRPHKKFNSHEVLASNGNSMVKIFQEVEKFKPDVIMTNTAVIPWGLYAGRAFNIPTVLLIHEVLGDKDPSLDILPSYREYAEILNKNTDYVLYNSQFVKNEYSDALTLPKTSDSILYPLPPLDKQKIDSLYKKNVISDVIKIAIMGALAPRKNQIEALRAAKVLRDQGIKNFRIDLYGDVAANLPYVRELRRFIATNDIADNVKIMGYATNVYEKMNEYNIVLSTSTYEPFGRTTIEAQLFGRIVITNNTGGGLDLVKDKSTGLIYESGNPKQLAEKIKWIISNQQEALKLGMYAKSSQLKKYITDSRYNALLDSVEYFADYEKPLNDNNIFDPIRSLFEYNHQLNERYKSIERLYNNRATRAAKGVVVRVKTKTKRGVKELISKLQQ